MRLKTLCAVFCVLFAGSLFLGHVANAKKYGGSSGSSRSSSRPGPSAPRSPKPVGPPSSGYGNTGLKSEPGKNPSGYGNTANKPSGPTSGQPSGYGNTATPSQSRSASPTGPNQPKMTPLQQQMNRNFSKQESAKAFEDYKAQQGKFQMSSKGGGYSSRETNTIDSIRSRTTYGFGPDYYSRRTVFYGSYGWSPPVYIYRSYPSFGIWDAMMLWFMLDHINDAQYAAMYYNHKDDPGMKQFRSELDRLSAENADLKAKVAKLDESSKSLEQQGVKPDPTYVPPDAAGIALAANIAGKGPPKSGGFPWLWIIGLVVVALIILHLRRRM